MRTTKKKNQRAGPGPHVRERARQYFLMPTAIITLSLLHASCGLQSTDTSDLSIVGGEAVTEGDVVMKSTVALVDPEGTQFCTGSLISDRKVVTAAHCLSNYAHDSLYVAFGPRAQLGHFTRERLRWVVGGVIHADFDEWAMAFGWGVPNDIALVELNEDPPAGFASVSVLGPADELAVGETLTLVGYGVTRYWEAAGGELRKVETRVVSKNAYMKEFDFGGTPGRSACMGDSGGPAFVSRGGALVLAGVTSRGSRYCNEGGTYTDVRYFADWLGLSEGS